MSSDDFNVKFNDLLSNIDGDRNSEHEYSVIFDTTGNTNSYLHTFIPFILYYLVKSSFTEHNVSLTNNKKINNHFLCKYQSC